MAGFEVAHVIHRHGLDDDTAREVEAALIDAYPGATNIAGGYNAMRGVTHADEIIRRYHAEGAVFRHEVILIMINRTAIEKSTYEAVRYAWKVDVKKAAATELVLAVRQGMIVGVFVATEWLPATPENFPDTTETRVGRHGFVGKEAPERISDIYLGKRVPMSMRQRGAANPIRYGSP
jgi:hypothetical protein